IAGLPAAPVRTEEAAAEPPVAATQVALNVPVPMRRPDYAPPPAVEQAQQVASADAVAPEVDLPVSAIVPERQPHRGGSDAILEMLASSAADARADVVINNPPVPGLRPRLRAEDVRG